MNWNWVLLWTLIFAITYGADGHARIWSESCYAGVDTYGNQMMKFEINLTLQNTELGRRRR